MLIPLKKTFRKWRSHFTRQIHFTSSKGLTLISTAFPNSPLHKKKNSSLEPPTHQHSNVRTMSMPQLRSWNLSSPWVAFSQSPEARRGYNPSSITLSTCSGWLLLGMSVSSVRETALQTFVHWVNLPMCVPEMITIGKTSVL